MVTNPFQKLAEGQIAPRQGGHAQADIADLIQSLATAASPSPELVNSYYTLCIPVHRVLRPGGRLAGEDWLAAEGISAADSERYLRPICKAWAMPPPGTCTSYAAGMTACGLTVQEAVDLREEMPLSRGFMVDSNDRAELAREIDMTADPIPRMIMEGLLRLGEGALAGAFTIGRFLAVKKSNVRENSAVDEGSAEKS